MKSPESLQSENDRLRSLLIEARTALLTSGCGEDELLVRMREEILRGQQ